MSTPFVGQIQLFGFGIVPRGWMTCSGQLLAINQNQPLFSLLGTTYGGDGIRNFNLPDLRGAFILSPSPSNPYGSRGGEVAHTLTSAEMAGHTHVMVASSADAGATALPPTNNFPAMAHPQPNKNYGAPANIAYGNGSNTAGGSQPHPNLPPFLAMNYCIAVQGIFPSRN